MLNLVVYARKQPESPFNENNKLANVAMRIVKPLMGTDRNITADNGFTNFDHINELK